MLARLLNNLIILCLAVSYEISPLHIYLHNCQRMSFVFSFLHNYYVFIETYPIFSVIIIGYADFNAVLFDCISLWFFLQVITDAVDVFHWPQAAYI